MQTHSFSKGGTWEYLRPVGWNTARSVQIKMSCFLWFLWSFLLQVVFGFVELWNKNFLPSKSKTHKGTASTFAVLLVKDSKSPTKVRKELKNDSDDANKTQHLRRFVCRLEFWAFSKKRKFTFRANFDTRQWWSGNRWEEPNYSGMWRATGAWATQYFKLLQTQPCLMGTNNTTTRNSSWRYYNYQTHLFKHPEPFLDMKWSSSKDWGEEYFSQFKTETLPWCYFVLLCHVQDKKVCGSLTEKKRFQMFPKN